MSKSFFYLAAGLRPKHWIKNLLVFALPISAGSVIGNEAQVIPVLNGIVAFVCLSLSSSANYLLNDILDIDRDRQHPIKSKRPVAAGHITVKVALFVSFLLAFISLSLASIFLGNLAFWAILMFTLFQSLYSGLLKHYAGYDIVSLAALYVARAIIPTLYENIDISQWFFLIIFSSAMLLVIGKRYAEIGILESVNTRKVLADYSKSQLEVWIGISITLCLLSYVNWILTFIEQSGFLFVFLSLIPMTIILIRLTGLIFRYGGEDPVSLFLTEKSLLLLSSIWLFLYLLGKGYLWPL